MQQPEEFRRLIFLSALEARNAYSRIGCEFKQWLRINIHLSEYLHDLGGMAGRW